MNADLQALCDVMGGIFVEAKAGGLVLVTAAIGIGIIFIGAKFLWGKTKQWLGRV